MGIEGALRKYSFVPCVHEIRQMIYKNNNAPVLYHFKFCEHFKTINKLNWTLSLGRTQFGL